MLINIIIIGFIWLIYLTKRVAWCRPGTSCKHTVNSIKNTLMFNILIPSNDLDTPFTSIELFRYQPRPPICSGCWNFSLLLFCTDFQATHHRVAKTVGMVIGWMDSHGILQDWFSSNFISYQFDCFCDSPHMKNHACRQTIVCFIYFLQVLVVCDGLFYVISQYEGQILNKKYAIGVRAFWLGRKLHKFVFVSSYTVLVNKTIKCLTLTEQIITVISNDF